MGNYNYKNSNNEKVDDNFSKIHDTLDIIVDRLESIYQLMNDYEILQRKITFDNLVRDNGNKMNYDTENMKGIVTRSKSQL